MTIHRSSVTELEMESVGTLVKDLLDTSQDPHCMSLLTGQAEIGTDRRHRYRTR